MQFQYLSNYLRMYRKRTGLSQQDLATLFGEDYRANIGRYERGNRTPRLETIILYSLVFQVSIHDLFPSRSKTLSAQLSANARSLLRSSRSLPISPLRSYKITTLENLLSALNTTESSPAGTASQ